MVPTAQNAAPQDPLIERLRKILHAYVEQMDKTFSSYVKVYRDEDGELAKELQMASKSYRKEAHDAVEMLRQGPLEIGDLKHVAGTLYLTSLILRWVLEQRTETYSKLLNQPTVMVGEEILRAEVMVERGDVNRGFDRMLELVVENRRNYALLMSMGFVYLRHRKDLTYAMRYFEKAAQTPTDLEPVHYRSLALQFLATCQEGLGRYKNALNTLLHAEHAGDPEPSVLYSISRMYALLDNPRKAVEYFERAILRHSAFYAMALVDPAFEKMRDTVATRFREYNDIFRKLGRTFTGLANRLLEVGERFKLGQIRKSVGAEIKRVEGDVRRVGGGYYTGYRTGIMRFYQGSYPEVIYDMINALQDRIALLKKEMKQNARERRRKQVLWRGILSPLAFMGSAIVVYFAQSPLLELLPFSFPMMRFVLPLVVGFTAFQIAGGLVKTIFKPSDYEKKEIARARDAQKELRTLVGRFRQFWDNDVSQHVDAAPLWEKLLEQRDEKMGK